MTRRPTRAGRGPRGHDIRHEDQHDDGHDDGHDGPNGDANARPRRAVVHEIQPWIENRKLAAEWLILFVAAPLVMAFALPPSAIWSALAAIAVIGLILLWITPDFRWRSLAAGPLVPDWPRLVLLVAGTGILVVALTVWLVPWSLFSLPRRNPELWLMILILYPFLSALPQELVYRVLFFRRYGALFANPKTALAANAACFGLAHLFYANWPAVLLATLGGAVFAWAYQVRGSFGFAWLLHALAGQMIFTVGLGILFYHGAVPG